MKEKVSGCFFLNTVYNNSHSPVSPSRERLEAP